jgi:periplasmic protein TonB
MNGNGITANGVDGRGYQLRSAIGRACLPGALAEAGRGILWLNAVCGAFLAVGLLGIRDPAPSVRPPVPASATALLPVEFTPPPESPAAPAAPEAAATAKPPEPEVPVPVVQPVVSVVEPSLVPFAVPVTIPVREVMRAEAASIPPAQTVGPATAPAPEATGGTGGTAGASDPGVRGVRTFKVGEGNAEGIVSPHPDYPPEARRKGIEGMVKLEIEVQEDGRVGEVRKLVPSGSFILDNHTISWVKRRWRFPAGKRQLLHTEFVYQLAVGR